MAHHHPKPMRAVTRPHRIVGTLERPLARPASPRPSFGRACSFPPATGVGDGVAGVAVWPGARLATTTRRWLAEYLGLQVVSVSVGGGVGAATPPWAGLATRGGATLDSNL